VYIPPQANIKAFLSELYKNTSQQESSHPEAVFIVVGDFNQENDVFIIPKYHQHVSCPMRGNNVLDPVYINISDANKAICSSVPTPCLQEATQERATNAENSEELDRGGDSMIQDCFENTAQDSFINIEEYTLSV
jgi:hypothetical protein